MPPPPSARLSAVGSIDGFKELKEQLKKQERAPIARKRSTAPHGVRFVDDRDRRSNEVVVGEEDGDEAWRT